MISLSPILKKSIGTFTLLVTVAGGVMASASLVYGAFSDEGNRLTFDGIIDCGSESQTECPGYYTVLTSSTVPISIQLTNKTKFVNGTPQWGDRVEVSALERDGDYYGKIIRITKKYDDIKNPGRYGTAGDPVQIHKGIVVNKIGQMLVIQFGSEYYVANVLTTTHTDFSGKAKNYAQIKIGDSVTVWGKDKKNVGFVATKVVVTKSEYTPKPKPKKDKWGKHH